MFINCPSCAQKNPENAKKCLHCEHLLPAGEAQRASGGLGVLFSFSKREKTTLVGVLLVVVIRGG